MSESKPVVLRSTANPNIRHLIRMRDNRTRRKADRVIVDGWRETTRAIDAGLSLCQQYVPESTSQDDIQRVDPHFEKTILVSDSVMDRICYGSSPRGVVAEFQRPAQPLDQLRLPKRPLILVLDRLEKPGNIGAIFRCADAVGIDAVLLCESADQFNPNAIRNSLGSVFHVPSASGTPIELSQFLLARGIAAVAARVESSKPLWEIDFRGSMAIFVGSEAEGLADRWQTLGTDQGESASIQGVRIPMQGTGDSLNVSVSAAVICYEARRQRGL
jgi:TrmH family RNA methyltransferase